MKKGTFILLLGSIPLFLCGQNVGIGTITPSYKLDIFSDTLSRAVNIQYNPSQLTGSLYGMRVSSIGNSTGATFGGDFTANSLNDGDSYGLQARAFMVGSGTSYGIRAINQANKGTRIGIESIITGTNGNSMTAMRAIISGQTDNSRPVTGLLAHVEAFSTNGVSYAIRGINDTDDGYSAWLQGKARIVEGEDASLTGDGYLEIGPFQQNIVLDDNEIMARKSNGYGVLHLQADGGNLLLCKSGTGKVGIGVQNEANLPNGYLFAVDGKGVFEELRVDISSDWPDYVFEDAYKKLPLDKLSDYIADNKHLPNIPSAKEVKENGLMLGEMQYKMMEKIEELTLYIIEQNERIVALEKSLAIK